MALSDAATDPGLRPGGSVNMSRSGFTFVWSNTAEGAMVSPLIEALQRRG